MALLPSDILCKFILSCRNAFAKTDKATYTLFSTPTTGATPKDRSSSTPKKLLKTKQGEPQMIKGRYDQVGRPRMKARITLVETSQKHQR